MIGATYTAGAYLNTHWQPLPFPNTIGFQKPCQWTRDAWNASIHMVSWGRYIYIYTDDNNYSFVFVSQHSVYLTAMEKLAYAFDMTSLHQCYGLLGVFHSSNLFFKVHHSERYAKWSRAGGRGLTSVTSNVLRPFDGRWAKRCAWHHEEEQLQQQLLKHQDSRVFPAQNKESQGVDHGSPTKLRSIHGGGLWIPQANMGWRVNAMKLVMAMFAFARLYWPDVVKYHVAPWHRHTNSLSLSQNVLCSSMFLFF